MNRFNVKFLPLLINNDNAILYLQFVSFLYIMEFHSEKCCSQLLKARNKNGFSQLFLANKLGISQKSYSHIESGLCKIELSKFLKIAHFTDTHPMSIIDLSTLGKPTWRKAEQNHLTSEHEVEHLQSEIEYLKSQNLFLQQTINKLLEKQE